MQCDKVNPLWIQWTINFHSSLGFYGFYSHSQHHSLPSPIPCPLSPCSQALLSQAPWHAFSSSFCVQTLNIAVPQGPILPILSLQSSDQVPNMEHSLNTFHWWQNRIWTHYQSPHDPPRIQSPTCPLQLYILHRFPLILFAWTTLALSLSISHSQAHSNLRYSLFCSFSVEYSSSRTSNAWFLLILKLH